MTTELAIGEHSLVIRELVGQGSAGSVWSAESEGARWALKVGTAAERRNMAREGRRLSLMNSPRLCRLRAAGRLPQNPNRELPAGAPFLLLEWAEGEPLAQVLQRAAPSSELALAVARDVGEALADLHRHGLAHGDIKPENIVVEVSGVRRARLIDLSLSGDASERAAAGGTRRYFAPEVFDPSAPPSDARARDLWALGQVLGECAFGDLSPGELGSLAETAEGIMGPIVRRLLSQTPGARPPAAWVRALAIEALGDSESQEEAQARRERAVWQSYLSVRRQDVERAASVSECKLVLEGEPARRLRRAIELAQGVESIAGRQSDQRIELHELDAFGRARWLAQLVGAPASRWPIPLQLSDAALAELLLDAVRDVEPGALTAAVLEGFAPSAAPEAADIVELTAAIASGGAGPEELRAAERMAEAGEGGVGFRLLVAQALRLAGSPPRTLALLEGMSSYRAHTEAAETLRRLGDRDGARERLDQVQEAERSQPDGRWHAIAARLEFDAGRLGEARKQLSQAPLASPVLEVRALLELSEGDVSAASKSLGIAFSLPVGPEQRARLETVSGMLAHAKGAPHEELAAFERAAEYAARAGAVLEEATYLTGVAAAATQLGRFGVALSASRRAQLLFEHLGRPADAARAILSRAAVFAATGHEGPATTEAQDCIARARSAGDRRCRAYAHLVLADCLPAAEPEGAEHAERARQLLGEPEPSDEIRIAARLLQRGRDVDLPRVDLRARQDGVALDARLNWWGARARRLAQEQSPARADAVLAELAALANVRAAPEARGPALAAGAELAVRVGAGDLVRRLASARADAARELLEAVPPELRVAIEALSWVAHAVAPDGRPLTPEQLADIETLVRALGERGRLRPLLDRVLDALILWTGVERGLLLLTAGERLVPRAARNLRRDDLVGEQRELSYSLAARALAERQPVVAVDAAGDLPEVHASVHALKLRSVLAVPLIARGEVLGVAYLDDRARRGAFGAEELAWVRLVATLAAVAIADARQQLLLRRAARRAHRAEARVADQLSKREAELRVVSDELGRSRGGRATRFSYDSIIGETEPVVSMLRLIDRVALSEIPVMILGESGSGKELVARAIHEHGPRAEQAFVSENCSAIPEGLLETTLFGHVRGAFTGASRPHAGLFEVADKGSLFLDEIAEMPLAMQAKLLRALEAGEIRPVGSERARRVDVRIIGATHRDMDELVRTGRFREDLYYRLNVIHVRVPPLRERRADIPLLVKHFVERYGGQRPVEWTASALRALTDYAWPGNVRQLENEVRRALVLADAKIERQHLSPDVVEQAATKGNYGFDLRKRVDALEVDLVTEALEHTAGNQTRAAELLGISRFGLQKMMKRLGICSPQKSQVAEGAHN